MMSSYRFLGDRL